LGGDFNSTVDSDVYAVMTGGSGSDGDRLPQLTSAYGTGLWRQGDASDAPTPLVPKAGVSVVEPPLTTCTPGFTETIDYIFSAGVQVKAVRPLPTRESLGKGTPNGNHPSDHLPIVADLLL
jgi:CCR4-NOT transcription complex subunit 6